MSQDPGSMDPDPQAGNGPAPYGYGGPAGYGPPPGNAGPQPGYGGPYPGPGGQQGYGTPPPGAGGPQGYGAAAPGAGGQAGYGGPPPGAGGYGAGGYGAYGGQGGYGGYGRPAAPKPGIIPLRPITIGEILDGAFTAIRWNPGPILGISAIVAAVSGVLRAVSDLVVRQHVLVNLTLPESGGARITSDQLTGLFGYIGAISGVAIVLGFLSDTILTGVLTVAIGQGVLGRKETLGSAWRATAARFWPLVGSVLLKGVFLVFGLAIAIAICAGAGVALAVGAHLVAVGVLVGVIGFLTAIVFFFIFITRWAISAPVVMLEHAGPLTSLRRSWRLVKRSSWRVWWIMALTQFIVAIVSGIISAPFGLSVGAGALGGMGTTTMTPSMTSVIITAIGSVIAATVTAPMTAGVIVLVYADLRMRREGMDITLQAAAANPAGGPGIVGLASPGGNAAYPGGNPGYPGGNPPPPPGGGPGGQGMGRW